MQPYSLSMGEKILVLRHRANMTKAELGKRVGVSAATISNYEHDKSFPGHDVIERLSVALDVSINMLLFGFDDPAREMREKPLLQKSEDFTK